MGTVRSRHGDPRLFGHDYRARLHHATGRLHLDADRSDRLFRLQQEEQRFTQLVN